MTDDELEQNAGLPDLGNGSPFMIDSNNDPFFSMMIMMKP